MQRNFRALKTSLCDLEMEINRSNSLYPTQNLSSIAARSACQQITCAPFVIVEVSISLATVVSNALVLIAFVRFKPLRTNTNIAIFSLAIADFLTGLVAMPYSMVIGYLAEMVPSLNHLLYNKYFCLGKTGLLGLTFGASLYTQVLISVERFMKICHHQRYNHFMSKRRIVVVSIGIWVYMTLLHSLPFLGWNTWTPGSECHAKYTVADFMRYAVTPHVPLGIILPLLFYSAVLWRVKKSARSIGDGLEGRGAAEKGIRTPQVFHTVPRTIGQAGPSTARAIHPEAVVFPSTSSVTECFSISGKGKGIGKSSSRKIVDRTRTDSPPVKIHIVSKTHGRPKPVASSRDLINGIVTHSDKHEHFSCEHGLKKKVQLGYNTDRNEYLPVKETVSPSKITNKKEIRFNVPLSCDSLRSAEVKVLKMTALTWFFLVILFTPYSVLHWCEKYFEAGSTVFVVFRNITVELMYLSSTINPLIYGFMNNNFKSAFEKLNCF